MEAIAPLSSTICFCWWHLCCILIIIPVWIIILFFLMLFKNFFNLFKDFLFIIVPQIKYNISKCRFVLLSLRGIHGIFMVYVTFFFQCWKIVIKYSFKTATVLFLSLPCRTPLALLGISWSFSVYALYFI